MLKYNMFEDEVFVNRCTQHYHSRSVEAFERKLEEAQKSLNIPSKDFIPVTFLDETDWAAELISSIPMIAIAGKASRKDFALLTLATRHVSSAHSLHSRINPHLSNTLITFLRQVLLFTCIKKEA